MLPVLQLNYSTYANLRDISPFFFHIAMFDAGTLIHCEVPRFVYIVTVELVNVRVLKQAQAYVSESPEFRKI